MARTAIVNFLAVSRAYLPAAVPLAATGLATNAGACGCRVAASRYAGIS